VQKKSAWVVSTREEIIILNIKIKIINMMGRRDWGKEIMITGRSIKISRMERVGSIHLAPETMIIGKNKPIIALISIHNQREGLAGLVAKALIIGRSMQIIALNKIKRINILIQRVALGVSVEAAQIIGKHTKTIQLKKQKANFVMANLVSENAPLRVQALRLSRIKYNVEMDVKQSVQPCPMKHLRI